MWGARQKERQTGKEMVLEKTRLFCSIKINTTFLHSLGVYVFDRIWFSFFFFCYFLANESNCYSSVIFLVTPVTRKPAQNQCYWQSNCLRHSFFWWFGWRQFKNASDGFLMWNGWSAELSEFKGAVKREELGYHQWQEIK